MGNDLNQQEREMIATAIAWVQTKAAALLAALAVVGGVIARMLWLRHQRDDARVERDNAESRAEAELKQRQIQQKIENKRTETKREQQERQQAEDDKAEQDKDKGGNGRTGLDNKW